VRVAVLTRHKVRVGRGNHFPAEDARGNSEGDCEGNSEGNRWGDSEEDCQGDRRSNNAPGPQLQE
jgi:hypothetical protein